MTTGNLTLAGARRLVKPQPTGECSDSAAGPTNACGPENTLDHDFAQTLRFPPGRSAGLVVPELPKRAGPEALLNRNRELIALLKQRPLASELWIIEPGRVRIHQRAED